MVHEGRCYAAVADSLGNAMPCCCLISSPGQTFCCAVQRQAKAVLKTLVAFAETLATSPSGNNSAIPPAAGRVSEACKGIVLLPKDNKSAVCERLAASTALINDSVLELTQVTTVVTTTSVYEETLWEREENRRSACNASVKTHRKPKEHIVRTPPD
eukprot:m.416235 g.416235  ORF g.416235 m.416235 type:complete len:157 (+) comp20182_c3_seq1:558-1028(+)